MKRILSMLMTVVIIFSMIPANVFAENIIQPTLLPNEQGKTKVNNENITVTGTNDFGDLISKDIQKEQDAQAEAFQTGYDVISLTVEDNTATVEYFAKGEAGIVVAIYSEDRTQLLTSGKVDITADETTTTISLPDALPEYFHASAYMVSKKDQKPLCSAFHTTMYTKDMQELLKSTIYDYNSDLVVNLDERTDTNFAVYNEDTIVVQEQSGSNTIVSVDDENLTYVIDNPSLEIRGLMYGDVLSLPYGEENILFVKVDRVSISGNTATITGLPIEMQDVFSHVKIDGDAGAENAEVNTEFADEGVSFEGVVEEPATRAIEGGSSFSHTLSYKFFKDVKGGTEGKYGELSCQLNGSFSLKFSVGVKYYIAMWKQEFKFSVDTVGAFKIGVEGTAKLNIPLGKITVPVFAGINVGFEPELVFEVDGKAELTISIMSKFGFSFVSGEGLNNISEPLKASASVEAEITIFVGFDLAPQLSIVSPSVAKVTASVPIGVEVTSKMTGSAVEGPEALTENNHSCTYCIAIGLDVKFGISIKMTLLDKSWLTFGFNIIELKWHLLDGYYSIDHNEFGWEKCPHKAYPLTITVMDSDNKPLEGVTILCTPGERSLTTNSEGKTTVYLPNGEYTLNAAKGDYAGSGHITVDGATSATLKVILTGNVTDSVKWSLTESGALTISGDGAIPSYGESSQLPWNRYISQVKSVSISDGITAIGANVFQNHSNLIYVYIGSSVSSIDFSAFEGLMLPVFSVSSANQYYTLDQKGVLFNKNKTILYKAFTSLNANYVIPDTVTNVASKAFAGQTELGLIRFSGDAPSIAADAFSGTRLEALYCTRNSGWTQDKLQQYGGSITWSSYDGLLGDGTSGKVTWQLFNDGVLRISGSGDMPNYASASNVPWYKHRESIKEVVVNGITAIGDYAFSDCSAVEKITIPASVSRIGKYAFYNCSSLADITIPEAVTTISTYTFYNCSSLTDITIPEGVSSVESYAFYGCTSLQNINIPDGVTIIEGHTFYGCTSLQEIKLHDGITTIGEYAFNYCGGLTELVIPQSVTNIGKYAFAMCSGVTSLRIRENWNSDFIGLTIATYAFANCTSLRSAKLPGSVVYIGERIFSGCGSLESISIPFIGDQRRVSTDTACVPLGHIFGTSNYTGAIQVSQYPGSGNAETYYIPSSLKTVIVTDGEIVTSAFRNCSNLQTVVLPKNATSIGNRAFENCTGLTVIAIPDGVTQIGNYAFSRCSNLAEVNIPDGVAAIGDSAFYKCSNLSAVTVPDSVTEIGAYAFYECSNLSGVTLGTGIHSIGQYAFYNCSNLTEVHIPNIGTWLNISFDYFYANPLYCAKNLYVNGVLVTNVVVPANVTKIGAYAFYNCTSLTGITLHEGITEIGDGAFAYCSGLSGITIPYGVITVGAHAFSDCKNLTEITIPNSVTTIGEGAFRFCSNLSSITLPFVGHNAAGNGEDRHFGYIFGTYTQSNSDGTTTTKYRTPSSMQTVTVTGGTIFANSFNDCKTLITVNIMEGVKNVASGAFSGCSNLQNLSVPGNYLSAIISDVRSSLKTVTVICDEIPSGTFENCTLLTDVVIENHVTGIGSDAFSGCSNLTYTIYDNAKYLGNAENPYYALISATSTSITSCNIHPDTKLIAARAFYGCGSLTNVKMPDGVISIGEYAFAYCYKLANVTIPDGVIRIGAYAFRECTSLTNVSIPDSVISIGDYAFYYCYNLTKVSISDIGITSNGEATIGDCAFQRCEKLTDLMIGDSVKSIGSNAFYKCNNLTNVTIGNSVTFIGEYAFNFSNLQYNTYDGCKYLGNSINPYVILVAVENTSIATCQIHPGTKVIYL